MADDPPLPRRNFAFKPRSFERMNAGNPASAEDTAASLDPAPARIDVRELCRQASQVPGKSGGDQPPRAPAANEVHALLRLNAHHAEAAGLNQLAPLPRRRSKRRRDYWLSLLGSWALIALSLGVTGPNLISLVYGLSGAVLIGVGLTWVFWWVMDDY